MQFQDDSPSPSNNSLLPSDYLNAPIFASRYHDDSADDDDNVDNDDNDVNHDVNGREIARERRSAADLARAINGVRQHWSPTETMQLVYAFVELDRENDGMRIIHGSNYYRELIALLLRKFPEFRHSQPAVKSKLIRMKNKYYRLQNRLDRSAVSSKEQLPEWYVLMDSVMERDEFHLRSARGEIRPRRGRPPKSRGRPAATSAVPKRERGQGDSSEDDLNPLDSSLDDAEAYSFPALPTLPTAANARTLQYPSPALPTLPTVAVTEARQYVSPPPRSAREVSALYTPTAAAALPLKVGAASAPGATGASAAVGQAVAAATAAGALALAVLGATAGGGAAGTAAGTGSGTAAGTGSGTAAAISAGPATGTGTGTGTGAALGTAAAGANDSGRSYLQSLLATTIPLSPRAKRSIPPPSAPTERLTPPPAAQDDRLTSPASAGGDKLTSPASAEDDRLASPPSARDGMRSARRTAGRTGLMAAEGLGDVMDEAVENAFADFEGLTQEWVERACGEFEGMVADMAERACLQFRSAAREFSESWKAGQDYKRRRRF
ncbi:unnamed protein product [Closterium sp. NIES-53]